MHIRKGETEFSELYSVINYQKMMKKSFQKQELKKHPRHMLNFQDQKSGSSLWKINLKIPELPQPFRLRFQSIIYTHETPARVFTPFAFPFTRIS